MADLRKRMSSLGESFLALEEILRRPTERNLFDLYTLMFVNFPNQIDFVEPTVE